MYIEQTPEEIVAQIEAMETIGRCDGCGLISHHILFGVCPKCLGTEVEEEVTHVPS